MKRVLLGMSGGVDSSTAAYLLLKDGYEVVGVTMSLFGKGDDESIHEAKLVCDKLGIEHYVVNYQNEFKCHVINKFISDYTNALTPNPCIECNKFLKFGLLYEKAQDLKCDYIATGHYAKIENGKLCCIDSPKDQSYFLYKVDKSILKYILFPLSSYTEKSEVRSIASKFSKDVSIKKDSQDICFIEDESYTDFLERNMQILPNKGDFVFKDGTVLGKHKGLIYYTVGQRKGLGISYKCPLYVIALDKEKNQVILGEEKDLYKSVVEITDVNLLVDSWPLKASGKIRYKASLVSCSIEVIDENNLKITFVEALKAPTLGQSLVLYDGNVCLGGGIIKKVY